MSSNANTTRLLDMLKSATSAQAPASNPPSSFLQPTTQTGSPREPSPAPPPPSLQAVSLQDLFASMTMAATPPPVSQPPAKVEGGNHQAKMLGMLGNLGRGTPSPSQVNLNGAENISGSAMPATPGGDVTHKDNLLSMFKPISLAQPPTAPSEPVITHLTVPEEEQSRAVDESAQVDVPTSKHTATPPPPAQPTLPTQTTLPKKSIFDFVSPFDVFDKPKPAGKPASPAPQPVKVKEEKNEPIKVEKPAATPLNQTTQEKQQPTPAKAPNGVATKPSAVPKHVRERQPSDTSSASTANSAKGDLGLVWQVGKVVPKGTEGHGPKKLGQHNVIDLSKPNLDGLITADEAQVVPTTILKTDNVSYLRGRTVGMTQNWLAYTMSRGRVRLIDRASGSRVILQLPSSASSGHILDIAVTDTLVGVLGPDHSVTVFQVPNGWDRDDPPCEMVSHILPGKSQSSGLDSRVEQIEWIRKSSGHALAIGGKHGLIVVDLDKLREVGSGMDLVTLTSQHKLLKTEGAMVSFCVNRTHQAIGALSEKSYLSLFNVSNLNRVWHRPVPTNAPDSVPSSLQFIEAHMLIGRANDTVLELMQITTDIGTLSSVQFTSPPPSAPHLHFTKSVYDPTNQILWVSPYSRGSLYGFNYTLKGHPPISGLSAEEPTEVIAFDKVGEYPMESVLSLVLGPSPADENVELFFATSVGFSQVIVQKEACEVLNRGYEEEGGDDVEGGEEEVEEEGEIEGEEVQEKEVEVKEKDTEVPVKVEKETSSKVENKEVQGAAASGNLPVPRQSPIVKSASKQQSPLAVPLALPPAVSASQPTMQSTSEGRKEVVNGDRLSTGISAEELQKALKKTEDRLANGFKQAITNQVTPIVTRLDSLSSDLVTNVSASVNRTVATHLTNIVQQEIKKSVLPLVTTTIQKELRSATEAAIATAVKTGLQSITRDLEAGLVPVVQRSISGMVPSLVRETLVPALASHNEVLGARLISDFKSEIIQIRKDLAPSPHADSPTEVVLRALTAQMSDLQEQLAILTIRLAAPAPPPAVPVPLHPATPPQVTAPPSPPRAAEQAPAQPRRRPSPPNTQLEEQFMSVLASATPHATLGLVAEHWAGTDYLFPVNSGSLLSQAILLTLIHRLAIALKEVNPNDPIFGKVIIWEKRVISLIDPRDPEVSSYYGKVVNVVQQVLHEISSRLHARIGQGQDGAAQEGMKGIVEVLNLITTKGV